MIDPPPPVSATASSLLYSRDFYQLVRGRLAKGGVLQQWLPDADAATTAAVARSIADSFPNVRVFKSVEGWGLHFLASEHPISPVDANALAERMPATARRDLVEWTPDTEARDLFQALIEGETTLPELIGKDPLAPALTDDRPINEYFLLRRLLGAPG